MSPHSRGFALTTVFWWIAGATVLITIGFIWTVNRFRWEGQLTRSVDHLYLAEGVLAREINRIKTTSWSRRWYGAAVSGMTAGGGFEGSFETCTYVGHAQDVAAFWSASASPAGVLPDHTDLFVRIAHPVGAPRPTSRGFFCRVVFRLPGPDRPTAFLRRRFAELSEFDPADERQRAAVVVRIDEEERTRERNRPETNVLIREVQDLERLDVKPDEIRRRLFAPGHVEEQVKLETSLISLLRRGRACLEDPAVPGPRYQLAVAAFEEALQIARRQDLHNQQQAVPLALYALARGEWDLARTCAWGSPNQATYLDRALEHLETIVRDYPWSFDRHPSRTEAPHAYLPLARLTIDKVNPLKVQDRVRAIGEAVARLEDLRSKYPGFHLWGEDGITGTTHGGGASPEDETVYWSIRRLTVPTLLMGGSRPDPARPGPQEILHWAPTPPPSGEFVHVGLLPWPLEMGTRAFVTRAVFGRLRSGSVMITGSSASIGQSIFVYDPPTGTIRRPRGEPTATLFARESVQLGDGRVFLCGGTVGGEPGSARDKRCEVYDPATEMFSAAASMNQARAGHRVAAFGRGQLLAVAGEGPAGRSGESCDPTTGVWTRVANPLAADRDGAALTPLADGTVLVSGGSQTKRMDEVYSAEIYVPSRNVFWPGDGPLGPAALPDWAYRRGVTLKMACGRRSHWTFAPGLGSILIGGGTFGSGALTTCELYDPVTMTFSPAPSSLTACRSPEALTVLGSGKLMVVGDAPQTFDPEKSCWELLAPLPYEVRAVALVVGE